MRREIAVLTNPTAGRGRVSRVPERWGRLPPTVECVPDAVQVLA